MVTPALPNITVASRPESLGSFVWTREGIDQALREHPESLNRPDMNGYRALHLLVNGEPWKGFEREDLARVHAIVRLPSIDLNSGDGHYMTPMHSILTNFPSSPPKTEILRILLEAGADSNVANLHRSDESGGHYSYSQTPLFTALRWKRPDNLVQLLIAYGGDAVSIETDSNGSRAVPLSPEELERLAAMTEAVKQQYMRPIESHLGNRDVAGIVAAYLICPKSSK